MNRIEKFIINKDSFVEILIPEVQEKHNYYYEPTEELNRFDEVTIVFKSDRQDVLIGTEMADIVLDNLNGILESILKSDQELSDIIPVGRLGYQYNFDTKNLDHDSIDYTKFSVWSGRCIPVWMYKKNKKIYFEISPCYPWLFSEPEKGCEDISFEEFMSTYKPIAVEEISRETVKEWLGLCNKIIGTMT